MYSKAFCIPAYSGSRYPNVPATRVHTESFPPGAIILTKPKSATLALMSSPKSMFEGFKSL